MHYTILCRHTMYTGIERSSLTRVVQNTSFCGVNMTQLKQAKRGATNRLLYRQMQQMSTSILKTYCAISVIHGTIEQATSHTHTHTHTHTLTHAHTSRSFLAGGCVDRATGWNVRANG